MKNTHLEHPEDSVLLGKQSAQQVINFLRERNSTVTVKWDGAPAIVFGTNPENGKFFVGTKSVLNKVKVKINYTHADIEKHHGSNPKVAGILHTCLESLPRVEGIYQGDFIGYGGASSFTPNTITYTFPADFVPHDCSIVFACHTSYSGPSMKELSASFGVPEYLKHNFMSTRFVNTDALVISRRRRIDYILGLASVVSNFVKYPDAKEVAQLQVAINKCIRENRPVDCISGNLLLLFNLISQAKELMMQGIKSCEDVDTRIDLGVDYVPINHEGFVMSNKFGTYKLVNRRQFSFYNFTLPKNW
ncbi:hypothetical protein SCREM1_126 [Synechococcus phage S-CREM1]|nr:hypothetical protein SCREM1_126 [Synechococcus phage S-CREM1]